VLAVLRAVQGFAASTFAAVALAYVGDGFPPRWRAPAFGAISTAFLLAGIVGQVYAQAVAEQLGWRWVFTLAAPLLALAGVALALVLVEPRHEPPRIGLVDHYRSLLVLAVRRELGLVYLSLVTVLLTFIAMYSALGPLLQDRFGLSHTEVPMVRLAGLPGMVLAPVAGALVGRFGPVLVTEVGFGLAFVGLAGEAALSGTLAPLAVASGVFVAGIATIVPAIMALVVGRAGSMPGGAMGITGLVLFLGASMGPLVAEVPVGFSALMVGLGILPIAACALVALSSRPPLAT
jgi:YNFM family putative membrane transporter